MTDMADGSRFQRLRNQVRHSYRVSKRVVRTLLGTDHLLRPDVTIPKVRIGSDYGGWTICLDLLSQGKPVVYSVGLGHDISFDVALAKITRCEIFGFDPTPKTQSWLATQSPPECFHYIPLGLADRDGVADFSMPSDPTFDDFSLVRRNSGPFIACEVRRLGSLAKQLGHSKIDLLKMDIEGAEYQVIDDICEGTLLPLQMLVEFHHRIDGAHVRDTIQAIDKLRKVGYRIFNVSSSGRELSFILEDLTR
jgi:FkbM family methyltransferase